MDTTPRPVVPVAILVRVSTKRQETERQVHELRAVAEARGWSVLEVIEEDGVSGAAKDADRHGLARVEALAAAGSIKKVLVHEVSRVGRRPAVVHGFVERLLDLRVSLYWHSQRVETMLEGGKRNPAAGMMLAVLPPDTPVYRSARSRTTSARVTSFQQTSSCLGETAADGWSIAAVSTPSLNALRLAPSASRTTNTEPLWRYWPLPPTQSPRPEGSPSACMRMLEIDFPHSSENRLSLAATDAVRWESLDLKAGQVTGKLGLAGRDSPRHE